MIMPVQLNSTWVTERHCQLSFFSPMEPVREQLHVTQHEHDQDLRVEPFFAGCQRLAEVNVKPNSSLIFFLFIQGTIVSSGMLLSLYLLSLHLRY